jgi:hypothetical protein
MSKGVMPPVLAKPALIPVVPAGPVVAPKLRPGEDTLASLWRHALQRSVGALAILRDRYYFWWTGII